MPIIKTQNGDSDLTHVLMDSGDIAMCPATDAIGRKYALLTQCDEGEQGTMKDTGREFPVKDGYVPGSDAPAVILEFGNYGALQQLLETLWGHGREKFPEDWVNLEGPEMVDGLFLLIDQLKSANNQHIEKALEMAEYGTTDGDHHKMWCIDQMVRALTGDDYEEWVRKLEDGEDGSHTYSWDEGIAP